MHDPEMNEQLRLLQQELVLTGEAIEVLRRDHRAEVDALRLEAEILRHCLFEIHPEMATRYEAIRTRLVHEIDPEAP